MPSLKGSSTVLKKDFSRNATFLDCRSPVFVPAGRKKKRSIEVSSGEKKKKQDRVFARIIKKVKLTRRTRRCAEAQGLVCGRFPEGRPAPGCQMGDDPPIKPQEPPRKTYLFLGFVSFRKAKPQITPKLWMINNVCRVRFCFVGEQVY